MIDVRTKSVILTKEKSLQRRPNFSVKSTMQVDAGSHAGFISHETASIRLCPAQNVAKSTGVLDLAQYVLGLSLR